MLRPNRPPLRGRRRRGRGRRGDHRKTEGDRNQTEAARGGGGRCGVVRAGDNLVRRQEVITAAAHVHTQHRALTHTNMHTHMLTHTRTCSHTHAHAHALRHTHTPPQMKLIGETHPGESREVIWS